MAVTESEVREQQQARAAVKRRPFLNAEARLAYLFLVPMLLIVGGLVGYPFVQAIYMSTTEKLVGYPARFVGLGNYTWLLKDLTYRQVAWNSLFYTFWAEAFKLVIGMVMALVLHQKLRLREFFRGTLMIPWILPTVVTALTWALMFNPQTGAINLVLTKLGLMSERISWLGQAHTAMAAIIIANVWRGFPFFGLAFLAGLQAIPQEMYEAAAVDGATPVQRFWSITLPHLRNVIGVTTVLSTIWTLNDFNLVWVMTRGGPGHATTLFAIYAYEIGFQALRWGRAVATSIFALPGLALVIWFLTRYLLREEVD